MILRINRDMFIKIVDLQQAPDFFGTPIPHTFAACLFTAASINSTTFN